MENTDSIAKKIQKLLALADGKANAAESEAALAKVEALLVKYQLDMSTIKDLGDTDDMIEGYAYCFSTQWIKRHTVIAWILESHFFVKIIISLKVDTRITADNMTSRTRGLAGKQVKCVKLLGKRHNVEIAQYVFEFLDRKFQNLWNNQKGPARKQGHVLTAGERNAYYEGLWSGLDAKLTAQRKTTVEENVEGTDAQSNALVVLNDDSAIKAFVQTLYPTLGKAKKHSGTSDYSTGAYGRGFNDSAKINIGSGIEYDGKPTLTLS